MTVKNPASLKWLNVKESEHGWRGLYNHCQSKEYRPQEYQVVTLLTSCCEVSQKEGLRELTVSTKVMLLSLRLGKDWEARLLQIRHIFGLLSQTHLPQIRNFCMRSSCCYVLLFLQPLHFWPAVSHWKIVVMLLIFMVTRYDPMSTNDTTFQSKSHIYKTGIKQSMVMQYEKT